MTIRNTVETTPIIDVHEHHIPEILLNREVNLLGLLQQSYAGWTQARPYPLPSETRAGDPMLEGARETTWEALSGFLEGSGSSSFVRNMVRAICELHEVRAGEITPENWREVDAAVRAAHATPGWTTEILKRAGIERIVTDPYTDPLLNARKGLGEQYSSVVRINALACGWHPHSVDHNGNSGHALLKRVGVEVNSFEDYIAGIETLADQMAASHQVAFKNALAYDRDISFGEPDEKRAREVFGKVRPTAEEKKVFGDFVVDRICTIAGERNIPVQMHLGTAILLGSHPLNAGPLIERHPRTRFLLMHLAYPWSRDLLAMAFVYRNIWIDLTWSWLLSPSHFKLALHEAIEILPDESRMMLGGDNWHVEETFGAMKLARQLIAEVLEEKIAAGYFGEHDARRLATKILRDNALTFFGNVLR